MSNDTQLKQAVLDELAWEPSLNAAHIGVTAKGGVITLMGHVDAYAEKAAAEVAAGRVKGVKAIAEEIEVKLPSLSKRDDGDIAAAAINRLSWDSSIPADAVKVKIQDGWVTLTGQVEWFYQKDAAAAEIRGLMGVTGVSNQISVKTRPNVGDISEGIRHALHRSWYDDDNVKVTEKDGKVELNGTVHAWADRQMAGMTAWAAPGTTSVQNNISVMN
jgi:osmotically-inducible protein OsmY